MLRRPNAFQRAKILDNCHNLVQRCMNASKEQNFVQNLIKPTI